MKGAVTLVFGSAFLAISASPRTKVVMSPSQTSRIRWSMLSGEPIFTKKACIADAPVICFTPNARIASGVKVSNAEANFSVSISRQLLLGCRHPVLL
jgi:hypothetical protein